MKTSTHPDPSLVISYLLLRKAIGLIGIGLPFVLVIGKLLLDGPGLQPSISDYYYTSMRNVFVGSLCAIGVFLLSYRGYERRDDLAGDLAFVCAVGTALFPTTPEAAPSAYEQHIGMVHYSSAAVLFATLAYFCLFLFTKTKPQGTRTVQKRYRNRIYVACGVIILAAIVLMAVYAAFLKGSALSGLQPVFWLESIAIIAFGVSWMVKGEAIFKDRQPHDFAKL